MAIIDLGATENFIIRKYIKKQKYSIWDKEQLYKLIILNSILFEENKK